MKSHVTAAMEDVKIPAHPVPACESQFLRLILQERKGPRLMLRDYMTQFKDWSYLTESENAAEGCVHSATWINRDHTRVILKVVPDGSQEIITNCDFERLAQYRATNNYAQLLHWALCFVENPAPPIHAETLPEKLVKWLPDAPLVPVVYVLVLEQLYGTFRMYMAVDAKVPDSIIFECYWAHLWWMRMRYLVVDAHQGNLAVRVARYARHYHIDEKRCVGFPPGIMFARIDLSWMSVTYTSPVPDDAVVNRAFGINGDVFQLQDHALDAHTSEFVRRNITRRTLNPNKDADTKYIYENAMPTTLRALREELVHAFRKYLIASPDVANANALRMSDGVLVPVSHYYLNLDVPPTARTVVTYVS